MARLARPIFLKAWRECRGLTQAAFADAVGTTDAVISLLERRSGDLTNSDPNKG
jgi:transcriptional regulator with XRE-family HTH domain